MSYQVIARKYRPQRFGDVVGQKHVTQTLANAVQQSRIAHAYLFCGPRGTGKTTIARIFAKCLNCTGGPKAEFDANDPRCVEISEGRSLDVLEIDGASNNGVEQVRELRETCQYAPASSKFKIYIIDEVHMLSTAAFNALLKTLEEPPAHVKFLFATTEPEKVLPTILSRCQRFDLRRIPSALIVKHLAHIAQLEKVRIDDPALHAIARGAEGAMRDAESTLDQLISFCGDQIQEGDVLSMFGLTSQHQLIELARAVLEGQVQPALRQLNELSGHGKDLSRLLSDLLSHFRNLLIYRVSKGDLGLLEIPESDVAALRDQAPLAGTDALTRIMEVLADAEIRFRDAASKKILLEIALLKAMEARQSVSLDLVLKRLQEMRQGNEGAVSPVPAPAPAPSPAAGQKSFRAEARAVPPAESAYSFAPAAASPVSPAATPASVSGLEDLWVKLTEAAGLASPFIRSYLHEAHPVSLAKGVLTIGFDPEFAEHLDLVDNPRNHSLLQTKLSELGHPNVQIKFVKAEATGAARPGKTKPAEPESPEPTRNAGTAQPAPQAAAQPAQPAQPTQAAQAAQTAHPPASPAPAAPAARERSAPVPFNKDDFKNDPLIQKALELFKGQIVEVRA